MRGGLQPPQLAQEVHLDRISEIVAVESQVLVGS